jgi:hypothetical protein
MANHTIHVPHELVWDPQPDITAYEIAVSLPLFAGHGREHQYYSQLPPYAQRHWRPAK